ncbi:MAG: hypothetical protein JW772_04730 [Candidatus Diapherotrites archaeon]|nr:hypothetical protein [Candidatus Diapherotrites archaeon]
MAALSRKKKRQANRFFQSPVKARRLKSFAERRGEREKLFVFHSNVGGKKRTVKYGPNQDLARVNNRLLRKAHATAVQSGIIKPRTYELRTVKYLHANAYVGVMEKVGGFGAELLRDVLNDPEDAVQEMSYYRGEEEESARNKVRQAQGFLSKYPDITGEDLLAMEEELEANLRKLSQSKKNFSYDLEGRNNIIITGYNRKTGRFAITILDQLHPLDHTGLRKKLEKLAK